MQIGDIFGQFQNAILGKQNTVEPSASEELVSTNAKPSSELLTRGNVFEGTVFSNKNGLVSIRLVDGEVMNARLDNGVNIKLGEPLFFQVNGTNANNQTQISLFKGEGTNNPTISSALSQAGLSVNPTTVAMVETMMENQMPIDKSSLLAMVKNLSDFPGTQVTTLVNMQKLGIPLTNEMVHQFENYANDTHQVVTRMEKMMSDIPELLGNSVLSKEEALGIASDILETFKATGSTAQQMQGMPNEGEGAFILREAQVVQGEGEIAFLSQEAQLAQSEGEIAFLSQEAQVVQNEVEGAFDKQLAQETQTDQIIDSNPKTPTQNLLGTSLYEILDPEELNNLSETLRDISSSNEGTPLSSMIMTLLSEEGIISEDSDGNRLMNVLSELFKNPSAMTDEQAKALLRSPAFTRVLSNVMEKQWLLSPEDLKGKNKIEDLYERLDKQMERFEQAFEKVNTPQTSSIAKAASDLRQNISFMNQINQTYTYVQIPLKLLNQNAHSDLYVYSNKKKMNDDGTLSAFLHLDLDNLGSTDVSIKMKDMNVSTHFFFEDEKSFDLIEDNIHILTQRLQKKGYNFTASVTNDSKKTDFVEDFLKQDEPSIAVHRYSFDMKA